MKTSSEVVWDIEHGLHDGRQYFEIEFNGRTNLVCGGRESMYAVLVHDGLTNGEAIDRAIAMLQSVRTRVSKMVAIERLPATSRKKTP